MAVYETLKELINLIPKVDNIDLYRTMAELQAQVWALLEENRTLKERLEVRDQLQVQGNAYFRRDDGPFCTRCWDDEAKLIRLHVGGGVAPRCPKCDTSAPRPDSRGPVLA